MQVAGVEMQTVEIGVDKVKTVVEAEIGVQAAEVGIHLAIVKTGIGVDKL